MLLCSFITQMYISRNDRLVLPFKNYYTSFKSILTYRILLHAFIFVSLYLWKNWMVWLVVSHALGVAGEYLWCEFNTLLVFCIFCSWVADPEVWSDLGSVSWARSQWCCALSQGGTSYWVVSLFVMLALMLNAKMYQWTDDCKMVIFWFFNFFFIC